MSDQKFVIFSIEDNKYAFAIDKVERILQQVPCTPIPRSPKLMLGVFELRGDTIPAVSLRERFGFNSTKVDGNFIIVLSEFGRYAIQCDEVLGIMQSDSGEIQPAPELTMESDLFVEGILKVNNDLHMVLNVDEVVPNNLRKKFTKLQEAA